jgi:hypothetical protein
MGLGGRDWLGWMGKRATLRSTKYLIFVMPGNLALGRYVLHRAGELWVRFLIPWYVVGKNAKAEIPRN